MVLHVEVREQLDLQELVFSFHYVVSRDQTLVIRLGLNLLSHLTGPK